MFYCLFRQGSTALLNVCASLPSQRPHAAVHRPVQCQLLCSSRRPNKYNWFSVAPREVVHSTPVVAFAARRHERLAMQSAPPNIWGVHFPASPIYSGPTLLSASVDFLKVSNTANVCLALGMDAKPPRHAPCGSKLVERRDGAFRSSEEKKANTLQIVDRNCLRPFTEKYRLHEQLKYAM